MTEALSCAERAPGAPLAELARRKVSGWRFDLGMVLALWKRDMLRLRQERSRWLGVVFQPLAFWVMIGSGLNASFQMPGQGGTSYLSYFYPGVLLMTVLFTAIFSTFSLIEDRESGFLQGVMAAPGSRFAMVSGKIAGVVSVACLQIGLFLALAPAAAYPWSEIAWGGLAAGVVLGTVVLAALNIIAAWKLPSTQAFHSVMSVLLLPMWVLSGAMFPLENPVLRALGYGNPMAYILGAIRGHLTAAPGGMLVSATESLWALAAMAVVLTFGAAWVCRRPGA